MEELKPCPFCGNSVAPRVLNQNEVEYLNDGDPGYAEHPYYQVACCMNDDSPIPTPDWIGGCGASSGFRKTPEEAIAAWNRRAASENKPKSYRCDADGEIRSEGEGFGEPGCDDEDGAGIYCKNCPYARSEEK